MTVSNVSPSLTEAQITAHNQQVMADRTRTIDQIKRLYAVVMGFALTTCFSNIYRCALLTGIFSPYAITLIAQGVSFVSLIVLFYLGAERLFDVRYLRPESRVPSKFGLFMDLFTSGTTAIWFLILADTFPSAQYTDKTSMDTALDYNIKLFAAFLLVLYIIDSIFLLIQILRTSVHKSGDYALMIQHHWFWFILNVSASILLLPIMINFPYYSITHQIMICMIPNWLTPLFTNYVYLSVYILVIHTVRFIADYSYAFTSYYPAPARM